ncbi:MAG: aspartate aminotransferase family protein, partial [Clostridia bacterium]|nr:aspartate aminotransferase family protein [Clostridia bacterium]
MDTRFAISNYVDAKAVNEKLDHLITLPMHSINPAVLKEYEENYFEAKCQKSKAMIDEAKQIIPGGVQHNLA